jgi:predicted acyltransferase
MPDTATQQPTRLLSIDQLRGYAIFGMILVNAKGMFGVQVNQLNHHQDRFTYADTIAPLFMFVVGISMRLSWLRRSKVAGATATRIAMVKRFSILVLIAFAIYMGWLWDALMDIGLAGLLAVMFIDKSPQIRAAVGCCMALLYQALVSFTVYGPWIMRTGKITDENIPYLFKWIPYQSTLFDVALNGGPFGPLSWCLILLFGTVAYDILQSHDRRRIVTCCLSLGIGLCAAGWVISMPWGEAKALWPISAYHMTLPFPLWSTGICFLTLMAFYLLCDVGGISIPTFSSVSMNALFIYIVQCVISETEAPKDIITTSYGWIQRPLTEFAPSLATPIGIGGILLFYGMLAALAYVLHRKQIYIKV